MSTCKSCGFRVDWIRINGKLHCYNHGTTTDHWDTCSAKRFRKIKETGTYIETSNPKGYLTPLYKSGIYYIEKSSQKITGEKFYDTQCNCIPWIGCQICCSNQ